MARAYYNEIDPIAAETLRELMRARLIAPGDVDERSIEDVSARDLARYTQCHFFAGIGVWSVALRTAGWSDDQRVWTGSCPCQPFSASGKGEGFDDQRHLWPAWYRLIRESRPHVVLGEQVASPDGLAWFDVVCADLEGSSYAVGQADTCAAGVGAPHRRQRLYFVAESQRGRRQQWDARQRSVQKPHARRAACLVGNAELARLEGYAGHGDGPERRTREDRSAAAASAQSRSVANADVPEQGRGQLGLYAQSRDGDGRARLEERAESRSMGDAESRGRGERGNAPRSRESGHTERAGRPGFWDDAIWIECRDGKLRPIPAEPALFPLAPRTPGRVGILRGAGNALCLPQAVAFIEAYLDVAGGR